MKSFADLLAEYMGRTGIGDAELARRIQVSRPTLLRWKEGVTTRPRYRDDVLRCAEILRLTEEETDGLLLACGYSPENAPPPGEGESPDGGQQANLPVRVEPGRLVLAPTTAGGLAVEGVPPGGLLGIRRTGISRAVAIMAVVGLCVVAAVVLVSAYSFLGDGRDYPIAAPGEDLIVIAPFLNYTAGGQGFNVAGRLREAIDGEVLEVGLESVHSGRWPTVIEDAAAARKAIDHSGASLVVWGEYDSGRVIARFTAPDGRINGLDRHLIDIPSSPAGLTASINIALVGEVSYVALLTLGQIHLERGEYDQAKSFLLRALDSAPQGDRSLTNVRLMLGQAYLAGDLADHDEAIWLFNQVLAAQPASVEALNGRGLAYLGRGRDGDTTRAIADLTSARSIDPQRAATDLNLAVAYVERGESGDGQRALASLERALAQDPDYAGAYVNRASIYVATGLAGDLDRAFQDLDRAQELQPDLAAVHVVRASAYLARGESGNSEEAIGELSRAIELEPGSAVAHFNRGLIYSELEDWGASLTDLRRAQELSPHTAAYNNALCLQLALSEMPGEAVQYCDWALALQPQGLALDSRALAYALIGNSERAATDYRALLAWLASTEGQSCRSRYEDSRRNWMETLQRGGNPFSPAILEQLRPAPALPGTTPC